MADTSKRDDGTRSGRSPVSGEESAEQKLQTVLATLWRQSKKTVKERVAILQEAKALWTENKLDEPARLRAVDSAHKLAGVLGTFGLPRGSELAREAEGVFEQATLNDQVKFERLCSTLDELLRLIEEKP